MSEIMLFAGNSNTLLAKCIARNLNINLGKVNVSKFSDGEIRVEYLESIRGKNVFLLQSTCAPQNSNLMELLLLADAAQRELAHSVTAIVPYFGYARQDRRIATIRGPIATKLIADLLKVSGIDRVLTVNLHSDQSQGFFDIPIENLSGHLIFLKDAWCKKAYHNPDNFVVVSPDAGGITRARFFAQNLNSIDLIFVNKHRTKPNVLETSDIVGNIENRNCLLVDDIIDTGATLISAAKLLKENGAKKVFAYCVHPVLSTSAVDKIKHSLLDQLIVTDSISLSEEAKKCKKIKQLSIASILSEKILSITREKSLNLNLTQLNKPSEITIA